MKKFVVFIFVLTALSCEKDDARSIDDLEVQIDLLDQNRLSTRTFNFGEDLVFQYTETNKTSDTIYYYGTHCPDFHFKVYDENENLIGDPIPNNLACTSILQLLKIAPKETLVSEINWFNDTANTSLPAGNYTLKFDNTIEIPELNDSKEYKLSIDFKIE